MLVTTNLTGLLDAVSGSSNFQAPGRLARVETARLVKKAAFVNEFIVS